jgi:LCP family protein required for cell wall assembly
MNPSNNFRKARKHHRPTAIDGFVVGGDQPIRGPHRRPINQRPNVPMQPPARVGNFRATDGFHPVTQPQMAGQNRLNPVPADDHIDLSLPTSSAPVKKTSHRRPRITKKRVIRTLILLIMVPILIVGLLFGNGYLKARQIFKGGGGAAALQANVDPTKLRGEGDGRINILLLGKGGPGHDGPDLTDTIIIASIDPIKKEAALLSIPRDLYVRTTQHGSMKINAVYATAKYEVLAGKKTSDRDKRAEAAGFKAIEETIQQTIGIPIHYHGMVDFVAFQKAIDTVGGIDLNVTQPVSEYMYINGHNYYLNVPAGTQHFNGLRALAYSRSRHTSARGDFDRAERQRAIMIALKEKALSLGTVSNPAKINSLINAFGDRVQTNMTIDEMNALYAIGKQINASKVTSLGLADPPNNYVVTANIGGLSVVIPRAGVNNYKEIQSFVRNRLKDSFLANENATVAIYNGTYTAGLAARTSEDLKSYGYNISTVADAPTKGYQNTVVVDLRNGSKKYTKRYLEQRFKTTTVPNLPDTSLTPGSADFVIILGQNEVSRLSN